MTREEAIKGLKSLVEVRRKYCAMQTMKDEIECLDMAIDALEQQPVLDKIRAEIEQTVSRYSISRERGCMGQVEWSDRLIKESEVLQIIDKYKTESEERE